MELKSALLDQLILRLPLNKNQKLERRGNNAGCGNSPVSSASCLSVAETTNERLKQEEQSIDQILNTSAVGHQLQNVGDTKRSKVFSLKKEQQNRIGNFSLKHEPSSTIKNEHSRKCKPQNSMTYELSIKNESLYHIQEPKQETKVSNFVPDISPEPEEEKNVSNEFNPSGSTSQPMCKDEICPSSRPSQCRKRMEHSISMGTGSFDCSLCDEAFPLESSLLMHMTVHSGKMACYVCGREYDNNKSLKRHIKSHTLEKPFICPECGKSFISKCPLERHLVTHERQKPFSCDVCRKTFTSKAAHKQHLKIHVDNPRHVCAICKKVFESGSHLKYHLTTHTGEKAFSCGVCGKSFAQVGNLKTHVTIHTGERPFKCDICGKGFSQNGNLRTHVRTHHPQHYNKAS